MVIVNAVIVVVSCCCELLVATMIRIFFANVTVIVIGLVRMMDYYDIY